MTSNEENKTQDHWKYRESKRTPITIALASELKNGRITTPTELTRVLQKVCAKVLKKPRAGARTGKPWWSSRIAALRSEMLHKKRALTRSNKKTNGSPPEEIIYNYAESYKKYLEEKTAAKERLHERLCDELDHYPWGDAYRMAMGRLRPRKPPKIPENIEAVLARLFPTHDKAAPVETSSEGLLDFTEDEIILAASKLRKGKSTGPDGIPAEVVQIAATQNPALMAEIMNNLLRRGEFPAIWKIGDLRLIPKEGSTELTPKYRPICLLNTLSKMFEHLIKKRLTEELDRTKGISPRQHAYSEGRSTNTAMETALKFMDKTFKRGPGWTPALILLDILNAFNCVAWEAIIRRLSKLNIKPYLIQIIQSYLCDRHFKIDGKEYKLTSGVPQGSILGPTLWNVVFDEITKIELADYCELVMYADDLGLLVSANNDRDMMLRGNLAMKRINEWVTKNNMKIATEKTTALIARGRRTAVSKNIVFELGGFRIKPKPQIKYLGVWFDEGLNFQHHAHMVGQEATKAYNCLSGILSLTTVRMARRRTIASVVEAKLLYGCEIWMDRMSGCAIKELEAVQRHAAIRVCKGYSTISADAALLLAGMVPIRIKAKARQTKYRTGRRTTAEEITNEWQERWAASEKGSWTRQLIPSVKNWIGRQHGELTYNMTQFLTGHGCFGSYLKLMNRAKTGECHMCHQTETARHMLFECGGWSTERKSCFRTTGELTPANFTDQILNSILNWKCVERYVDVIMEAKKK